VRFHNKRGIAERWIKEGKQAVKMARLSCHRFRPDEVQLLLNIIADNWETCGGGRLVKHAAITGCCWPRVI
jgi:hypothetical protein